MQDEFVAVEAAFRERGEGFAFPAAHFHAKGPHYGQRAPAERRLRLHEPAHPFALRSQPLGDLPRGDDDGKPARAVGKSVARVGERAHPPYAAFETYQKQGYTVQYDSILSLDEMNSDASSSQTNDNWAYDILEIPETLAYFASSGKDYADITVGILDTGLDYTHELFAGRITRTDLNFGSNDSQNDCMDMDGHGTSVAGIVALSTPDNVKIEPYKLVGDDRKVYTSTLLCCLSYILSMPNPPDVLNMSIGIPDYDNEINIELFEELIDSGIVISVSAGNQTSEAKLYKPAGIQSVITVSASDEKNNRCSWSNHGELVDIAAPGNSTIYTAKTGGGYREDFGGTSASAPFVAAAAATVLMQNEKLSPAEVESKIKEAAVPIQKRTDIVWCGAGLVNFYSLIDQPKLGDVEFSYTGGDYYKPIDVELSCSDPNAKIIYTTDMTVPSLTNGTVYTDPIEVTEHSRILTVAYDENNKLKSDYTFSEYRVIYEVDENDFEITDKGTITAYNGKHKSIIIPDTINGVEALEIGEECFFQSDVEYVELPDCITEILKRAFKESALEVIIAPGAIGVGIQAFMSCYSLYSEYMPNVLFASGQCFYECMLLTDFSFKDKVLDAGELAFAQTAIQEATFPNLETQERSFQGTPCYTASLPKLTELNGGFQNCSNLESIYIPNVTEISGSVFAYCDSLSEDAVPFEQFTKVGSNGLAHSPFERIILSNCTEIGDYAFIATEAKYISAPKATTVGKAAFRYTYSLEEVNLESVVSFADEFEVFCDSVDLKYLYLPKASTIPAFQWQQSLEYLENGTLKTELEFIYAPKATGFNYVYNNGHQMNDMQFLNELKFIYAPNLQTIDMTDGTFPLNTTTTLYLSDEFSFFNILKKPQLKIVAPQESYAHTVANENGYDFIASDSMTKTRGRSICSSVAGIRFGFYWNNIDEIEDLADNIEYGFIYSQKGVEDLSIETVDGVNVRQTEAVNRVDNGKSTSFNLVIANIPNGYLDREITARAYVCIDGMYFYSNIQRGSFSEVANLVLADDEIDQNTKNAVKNLLEV